jgi:glycosyltransferase involved in cell wall biosynthesis
MKIGIVLGRIGGEDGVALETEKWITVLRERMGCEVQVLAGALEGEIDNVELLPELAFDHPQNELAQRQAFFGAEVDSEAALLARLDDETAQIAAGLRAWIARHELDCLVSENSNALPFHLTTGLALTQVFRETGIRGVCHGHDFRWERGERYVTPYAGLQERLEQAYPCKLDTVRHAVINRAAQTALAERYGIDDAIVVPNVMDFDAPFGQRDAGNADLRSELGLRDDDTLLFQITRIVRRKGIETAIELVSRLGDGRIKLLITGTAKDEEGSAYVDELRAQIAKLGLGEQVLFCGERFDNQREPAAGGKRKVYSLSDAYAHADACTYFSTYEGFGNAFVEAVVAKRPIFVNDYEPVYWPDIGSLGFETVLIRRSELTDEAVAQAREVLADTKRRDEIVEQNFALGREHFSYQALEQLLRRLFG